MIRFEEITNKNIWKVCMLEPFDEQKDYVAENMQSLAEAYATRNMLDKKYQGQGLGKQTIDAVMDLIRTYPFGEAKRVWLSYEPENTHARDIYRKYGFVENGEVCGNEIVAVYEL